MHGDLFQCLCLVQAAGSDKDPRAVDNFQNLQLYVGGRRYYGTLHMNEIRFGSKVYLIGPPDSDDAGQFFM